MDGYKRFGRKEIREQLKKALSQLSLQLKGKGCKDKICIILFGGALLSLRYGLTRRTGDIDFSIRAKNRKTLLSVGSFLAEYGFQLVSEEFLYLHPDYEGRLEFLGEIDGIQIFGLSAMDLAISKIGACRGREELEDLLNSCILESIDLKELEKEYFEALTYWVGDEKKLKNNWEVFLHYVAESKWKEKLAELGNDSEESPERDPFVS